MPPLPTALLALVTGSFLHHIKVDSAFYPHLLIASPSSLKSLVASGVRQDALNYYRALAQVTNYDYMLGVFSVIVLASLCNPRSFNLVKFVASALAFIGALAVELVYSRPLIAQMQAGLARVNVKSTEMLWWISKYHAATVVLLLVVLSIRLGIDQDREYDDDEHDKQE